RARTPSTTDRGVFVHLDRLRPRTAGALALPRKPPRRRALARHLLPAGRAPRGADVLRLYRVPLLLGRRLAATTAARAAGGGSRDPGRAAARPRQHEPRPPRRCPAGLERPPRRPLERVRDRGLADDADHGPRPRGGSGERGLTVIPPAPLVPTPRPARAAAQSRGNQAGFARRLP